MSSSCGDVRRIKSSTQAESVACNSGCSIDTSSAVSEWFNFLSSPRWHAAKLCINPDERNDACSSLLWWCLAEEKSLLMLNKNFHKFIVSSSSPGPGFSRDKQSDSCVSSFRDQFFDKERKTLIAVREAASQRMCSVHLCLSFSPRHREALRGLCWLWLYVYCSVHPPLRWVLPPFPAAPQHFYRIP